jgi:putative transposase
VKEIKPRLKDILLELFNWLDLTVIEGAICSDHLDMYFSVSLKYSPAYMMKILKGKNAEYLRRNFPELGKKYWGLHIADRSPPGCSGLAFSSFQTVIIDY